MPRNYSEWKQRGLVPIDRPVAPESFEMVSKLKAKLRPELEKKRRAEVRPKVGGIAVIHYNLFEDWHIDEAPATSEVLSRLPGAHEGIDVELGKLEVYGPDNAPRLGFGLKYPQELDNDFSNARNIYEAFGVVLRPDPLTIDGEYVPRFAVADIQPKFRQFFENEATLDVLDALVQPVLSATPLLALQPTLRQD